MTKKFVWWYGTSIALMFIDLEHGTCDNDLSNSKKIGS